MNGNLTVWGFDENGYWKMTTYCSFEEIEEVLSNIENYEDYDFQSADDGACLQYVGY